MIDRVLITPLNVKNVNNKNTTSNYVNLFSLLLNLKLSISHCGDFMTKSYSSITQFSNWGKGLPGGLRGRRKLWVYPIGVNEMKGTNFELTKLSKFVASYYFPNRLRT